MQRVERRLARAVAEQRWTLGRALMRLYRRRYPVAEVSLPWSSFRRAVFARNIDARRTMNCIVALGPAHFVDINAIGNDGMTSLLRAVAHHHPRLVGELLRAGADAHVQTQHNGEQLNSLELALRKRRPLVARTLLLQCPSLMPSWKAFAQLVKRCRDAPAILRSWAQEVHRLNCLLKALRFGRLPEDVQWSIGAFLGVLRVHECIQRQLLVFNP